jgi:amino acid transporter
MTTERPGGPRIDRAARARVAIRAARPVRGLAARSPVHRLDRRRLSAWAVAAQSLGSIAPAAAASTTPAVAIAAGAGKGAIVSALLAVGIALLIAAAINVFTRRLTTPGSLYTFAVKGLGPFRGYLVGCALLLGYAGIAAACIAAAAHYLTQWSTGGIPVLVAMAVAVVAVVTLVARRGTRSLWPALLIVEVLSVAAVLAASIVLITSMAPAVEPPAPTESAISFPGSGMLIGVVVGVVISASGFVGFESGTALGPETRRPFLVVPRVVRWAPIATGAVLVVSTVAQVVAFDRTGLDAASVASPLPDLLATMGNSAAWSPVLDLAIGASFVAGALASVTALARLLFALSLERVLPQQLAHVHPRHRTPHIALLCAVPLVGGVPIVALAAGAPIRSIMDTLVAVGVLGYLLAYLGVSLAAPRFLVRIGESTFAARAATITAAVAITAVVSTYLVYQLATGAVLPIVVVAIAIGAGALYFVLAIRRRPDIVGALGLFDATSAEDIHSVSRDDRNPAA